MTREEAIKKIKEAMPTLWKETKEAIQVLIPEFAENEDEKIRKEMIRYFTEMKKGGSAALPYDDCIAYLERQKETGIRWFKSDNVKNPDKPYIDKAGMFYTTDGRMCHASEIEKQKERKDYRKLYEDIAQSEWFKKTYINKSLGEEFEQEEQRQEWSEKDEKEVAILEGYICSKDWSDRHIDRALGIVDELVNKVKSLRHQPKQEWSEEDSDNLERIDNYLWMLDDYVGDDCAMPQGKTDKIRGNIQGILSPWLKSLPERFILQPKQEQQIKEGDKVSIHCRKDRREDITITYDGEVGEVIHVWDAKKHPWGHIIVQLNNGCNTGFYEDELEVLDEPSWKPSEEQMDAMKNIAYGMYQNGDGPILRELYEQLEKLI